MVASKYAKKYINKYNTTTTTKKEKQEKQELRLMFGYQPTNSCPTNCTFQKFISTKGNSLF